MIRHVMSLDAPELGPYRTLRRTVEHNREGIFVGEGGRVVSRLAASSIEIVSALMTEEWLAALRRSHAAIESRIPEIYLAEKKLLESIVGFTLHQGIMAIGRVPHDRGIEAMAARAKEPFFFVALDGLASAENVGVVVRNCAAFGADGIIAGPASGSPYLRRAVRNSMGAVFALPVTHPADLAGALAYLHEKHGARIVATVPDADAPLEALDTRGNVCIVLGSEGEGISGAVLAACTERIGIPMENGTDSLNVASASAVFLYEIRRQLASISSRREKK